MGAEGRQTFDNETSSEKAMPKPPFKPPPHGARPPARVAPFKAPPEGAVPPKLMQAFPKGPAYQSLSETAATESATRRIIQ